MLNDVIGIEISLNLGVNTSDNVDNLLKDIECDIANFIESKYKNVVFLNGKGKYIHKNNNKGIKKLL